MLCVRTTPTEDLTTRARIRDAAIDCFAEQGFAASFRTIAARAGVSPGLITHHFGTKARLRAECDAEVLRRYHALKSTSIANPRAAMAQIFAVPGDDAALVVYMLRAIQSGGASAREFLDGLAQEVRAIMAESQAAGLVRPSRDEDARVRFLTYEAMGTLLVKYLADREPSPADFLASLRSRDDDMILPMLELYTEGVFTDRSLLDDYAQRLWPGHVDEAGASRPHGKDTQ